MAYTSFVKTKKFKKYFYVLLVIFLLFLSVLSLLAYGSLFGFSQSNKAHDKLKPVIADIEKLGGKKICDLGDNGKGLDNTQPTYTAYYKVTDGHLEDSIKTSTSNIGFDLTTDDGAINQLKQAGSDFYSLQGAAPYNSHSSYLIATDGGNDTLNVLIDREGPIAIKCGHTLLTQNASGSTDIISLSLILKSK